VTTLDGPLDVLRIVVQAADDNEILDAARDVEFPVFDEAQIFRAQEGTFASVEQISIEGLERLLWTVPIALGHTWAINPDFSDLPIFELG